MSDQNKSCEYCTPKMTIRDTVFFEHIPDFASWLGSGGQCSIIANDGNYFLRYTNSADAFSNEIYIDERFPIKHCPMCGREL